MPGDWQSCPKTCSPLIPTKTPLPDCYGTDGKPTGSYLAVNPAPSGLAVNRGSGFKVTDGQRMCPSTLIFVTENGTILGWSMDFTNPTAGMFEPEATVDADGSAGGD